LRGVFFFEASVPTDVLEDLGMRVAIGREHYYRLAATGAHAGRMSTINAVSSLDGSALT
jgi:hypothetical protein